MRSEEREYLDYLHNLVLAALEHLELGNDGEAWMHLRILKGATATKEMDEAKDRMEKLRAKVTAHERLRKTHDEIMASWEPGDTAADVASKMTRRFDRKTIRKHIRGHHMWLIGNVWVPGDTPEQLQRKLAADNKPIDLETLRELLPRFIELRGSASAE